MNKPNFIFKISFILLVLSVNLFAQTENKQTPEEPSYDVILQVVIGSNNPNSRNATPQNLSNTIKKLKSLYNFSNYGLETTFFQRTSNTIEYKSVQTDFTKVDTENPVFSEWSIKGLQKLPDTSGRNALVVNAFRFGARVPIMMETTQENGVKTKKIIYDQIGITTYKFTFNENEPTVIGSLTTAKPDEMIFLVLTVRKAE